jgi:Asp-tRNA(Asn)/Glu-tRNA(Gln) amidotransferase A subunit family amidase
MIGEDVLYLTVREIGDRIRKKKLSPVALTEAYLARSERIGSRLNAYATLTPERALREARQAEKKISAGKYRGPLHGIPFAAKDLLAARGYPTMWGARPLAGQQFEFDANVIRRLRNAGAVLLGKAAMIELAGGLGYRYGSASISGPAKNPWNENCWTCGSSSGSGTIIAAGLAGFAIGTETWGSIICPSAYCGVSGLRPTFGRVGRGGAMALSYSMDKIGPMARSADDCGLILEALAGHDGDDSHSLPQHEAAFTHTRASGPIRVGWLTNAWKEIQPEVKSISDAALDTLRRAGASITNAELPEGPWEAAAGIVISVEGASAYDALIDSGKVANLVDPLGKIGGYINQTVPGSDFVRAQRLRAILQKNIDAMFDRFDVLAAASLPIAATTLDTNLETDLSFADPLGGIGNFCGLPAISVPSGLTAKNLPVGIQFVGRALEDQKVLAAANLFQQHSSWHRKRPPL